MELFVKYKQIKKYREVVLSRWYRVFGGFSNPLLPQHPRAKFLMEAKQGLAHLYIAANGCYEHFSGQVTGDLRF